jgi:hypothetical protein
VRREKKEEKTRVVRIKSNSNANILTQHTPQTLSLASLTLGQDKYVINPSEIVNDPTACPSDRLICAVRESWGMDEIKKLADSFSTNKQSKKTSIEQSKTSIEKCSPRLNSEDVIDAITGRDKHGSTVIEWAGGMGRLDVIDWALSYLNTTPSLDHTSCLTHETGTLKRKRGDGNKNRKREGRTFLHFACQYGRMELVETVLSNVKEKGRDSKVRVRFLI